MRSLWLKLMVAFAFVILVGAAVDSALMSRATSGQFNRYVTQSGQVWAQRLAPALAAYYAQAGSWAGVETLLATPWQSMSSAANWEGKGGWGRAWAG